MKSTSIPRERDSNMELLRIIAAFGVIVLHYNNANIGGAYGAIPATSAGAFILYYLEAMFLCAVNLFMMLMGYFQFKKRSINIAKPLILLMQVSFVRIVAYLLNYLLADGDMSVKGLITAFLPSNHFIAIYCTVYLLSPYLNLLLDHLSIKRQRILAVVLLLLFSLHPTALHLLSGLGLNLNGMSTISDAGAASGYTLVNYIMMYILGALCTNISIGKKSVLGFFLCQLPLFALEAVSEIFGVGLGQRSYYQPLVIGCSFFAVLIFKELKLGSRRWINTLSGGTLMIYLTHKHLFPLFHIPEAAAGGTVSVLVNLFITCIVCYASGWLFHMIYTFLSQPLTCFLTIKLQRFSIDTSEE